MAIGYLNLGEYSTARKLVSGIIESEPENRQAIALLDKIEKRATHEGFLGMALVGGLVAAAVGVAFALFRNRNH